MNNHFVIRTRESLTQITCVLKVLLFFFTSLHIGYVYFFRKFNICRLVVIWSEKPWRRWFGPVVCNWSTILRNANHVKRCNLTRTPTREIYMTQWTLPYEHYCSFVNFNQLFYTCCFCTCWNWKCIEIQSEFRWRIDVSVIYLRAMLVLMALLLLLRWRKQLCYRSIACAFSTHIQCEKCQVYKYTFTLAHSLALSDFNIVRNAQHQSRAICCVSPYLFFLFSVFQSLILILFFFCSISLHFPSTFFLSCQIAIWDEIHTNERHPQIG